MKKSTSTESRQTLPITLFVVDDDDAVVRRVARESLRRTNLGVLTADHLANAAELIDGHYPIGAILADLNFRSTTHDEKHELHDGFDLLRYMQNKRPNVPAYVLSVDAPDRAARARANEMGLDIRGWYDKLGPSEGKFSPWERIERDLILGALKSSADLQERVREEIGDPSDLLVDERIAEKVQAVFSFPRVTYLQRMPDEHEYVLKCPLEVHCWPEEGEFLARAVKIPLLIVGRGEDAFEAVEDLASILATEKAALDHEDDEHITGYARYIREQLDTYLDRQ